MSDACLEPMDPSFAEYLARLPKSDVRYKDEFAPVGECTRCFSVKGSTTHARGSVGYMHDYVNPAGYFG